MDGIRDAETVCQGQAKPNGVPQSRLDRHEHPAGAQEARSFVEARIERTLKRNVVQHQSVQDDVE
jgi:hypothetical protein